MSVESITVATLAHGKPRLYVQQPESAYVLPVDDEEGERLQKQHKLFENLYHDGRLIPEDIARGILPTAKILDAGTGTGIWAVDAASRLLPTVSFVCIDISTRLFPVHPPPNLSFLGHSTLSPLPADWVGSFDVVHQRLMMAAFRSAEWPVALGNFYKALKPGGVLLLMEGGKKDYGATGSAVERAYGIAAEMMTLRGVRYNEGCANRLPALLEEAGFVDVHIDEKLIDLSGVDGKDYRTNLMAVLRGMSGKVSSTEGLSWQGSAAEFEALVDAADAQYASTPGMCVPFVWFTAKKPL